LLLWLWHRMVFGCMGRSVLVQQTRLYGLHAYSAVSVSSLRLVQIRVIYRYVAHLLWLHMCCRSVSLVFAAKQASCYSGHHRATSYGWLAVVGLSVAWLCVVQHLSDDAAVGG
jgi:hypothetical protein